MADRPVQEPTHPFSKGPFSARSDPTWLNQATVKGAILVLAGTALTTATANRPARSGLIVGLLLLGWGLSEVWFRLVRKLQRPTVATLGFPVVIVLGGLVLITDPGPDLTVLLGATLVVRALVLLYGWITRPGGGSAVIWQALPLLVAGAALVLVPEAFVLGLRAVIGGGAILTGMMLLATGLGTEDEQRLLDLDVKGAGRLVSQWLRDQRLDPAEVDQISETLFFEPPRRTRKLAAFWVMMCLATAIAAFAVIQDSTAVVIGAMLVAPLMTPIMGAAAAMVNGWATRMVASLALVASAVAVAILLSWIIAAWLPSVGELATNGQITSRTSPNLLDLCIAVAAGAAGAYATVNPRVSSSLSGVAIAVALVPPLAVVGITLEAGHGSDALGAFLLFATNFVSIIIAGSVVLILTGYATLPGTAADRQRHWRVVGPILVGAVIVVVPLSLTSVGIWQDSNNTAATEKAVDAWLGDDLRLSVTELSVDGSSVDLLLAGSDEPPPLAELQRALDEAFGETVDLDARLIPSQELG